MRVAILITSAIVALFFGASLALTFLTQGYITALASDFVTDRTLRFVEPTVKVAEQALRAPSVKRVLGDEAARVAQEEIADYRRDPRAFIARLVAGEPPVDPGPDAPLEKRVLRWKVVVRQHFRQTLERLLWDLRIFAGSNLTAALLAMWCTRRARQGQVNWLVGVAGLLLASVAYGAYIYVDGFGYFRILFNTYLGWWYPVLLAGTFLGLYLEYGRQTPEVTEGTSQWQSNPSRTVTTP